MNWFTKLLNNPNAHLIGAAVAGVTSKIYPQYAGALEVVAGALVGTGILVPEQPSQVVARPSEPISLPLVQGGPAIDYNQLAAVIAQLVAKKK